MSEWKKIVLEELPTDNTMFVVRGNFTREQHGIEYVTDPYTVWYEKDRDIFPRWPHLYPPTHWLELPKFYPNKKKTVPVIFETKNRE